MATYNSIQYEKALSTGTNGVRLLPNEAGGLVRVIVFDYVQTGTMSNQDVINIGKIPSGASILQAYLTAEGGTLQCNWTIYINNVTNVFVSHPTSGVYPIGGITTPLLITTEESLLTVRISGIFDGGSTGERIRGYVLYAF